MNRTRVIQVKLRDKSTFNIEVDVDALHRKMSHVYGEPESGSFSDEEIVRFFINAVKVAKCREI